MGDTGDTILSGDAGADAIVGDNASITRGNPVGLTSVDPDDPGQVLRTIVLLDKTIGGDDEISGGDGGDRIYGGPGTDLMAGGPATTGWRAASAPMPSTAAAARTT